MFLGRYSGSFFVGGVIVALEAYGMLGSFSTLDAESFTLRAIGPIPAGSVLRAINVQVMSGSGNSLAFLYLALAGTPDTSEAAFRVASNLVNVVSPSTFSGLPGLGLVTPFGSVFTMRIFVGRKIVGGSKWLLFGGEEALINSRMAVAVNLEIVPESGSGNPRRDGGTVLDVLRASAADSL